MNGPRERQSYRARWIFPVEGEPIENGTIHIEDGRIAALSTADHPQAIDLGDTALIPGLVNAHTHLEFSDLEKPLDPPRPFTAWLQTVVGHRRERGMPAAGVIARGLGECARAGAACVGEITTDEMTLPVLEQSRIGVTSFREIIGLQPERVGELVGVAERFLRGGSNGSTPRHSGFRRGLSPHAPYSVHPELFHKLVALARQHNAPLSMHIAETQAEVQLLERGTGSFVALLQSVGVWRPDAFPRDSRILDYLRPLSDAARAIVVHGNYLAEEDIRFLASHPHVVVVYCPRTHAFFGHAAHPWLELLARGASVALGTDSRASNPDLSLWNELLFLRRKFPQLDPRILLRIATSGGARALGRKGGTLTPGAPADLAAVALHRGEGEAYSQLFHDRSRVSAMMRGGEWVASEAVPPNGRPEPAPNGSSAMEPAELYVATSAVPTGFSHPARLRHCE